MFVFEILQSNKVSMKYIKMKYLDNLLGFEEKVEVNIRLLLNIFTELR